MTRHVFVTEQMLSSVQLNRYVKGNYEDFFR